MTRARIAAAALFTALAACSTGEPASPSMPVPPDGTNPVGDTGQVVRVFDGDSLEIDIGGSVVEVRMAGINAPEGDECHGDAARDALISLIGEGPLVLEASGEGSDDYGRLLRYLWVDGVDINRRLLDLGHAVALSDGHPRETTYRTAARDAMTRGIGMWESGVCGPASDTPVAVGAIEFDPPGRDEDNTLQEYVEIRNVGDATVDVEGWTLRDESTRHRYHFAAVRIGPGESVRVRTGCGEDRGLDLVWCAADPVWNNGGDTIIVQDEHGNVVAWEMYEGRF